MQIVKGIPVPVDRARLYPFADMEVGDCLVVGLDRRAKVVNAAKSYGRNSGKRFRVRTDDDGVRIWRVA